MVSIAPPPNLPKGREIPEVGVEGFAIQQPQDPPLCPQGQKCPGKQAGSHAGGGQGGIRLTVVCHWLHSECRDQRR